MSTPWESCYQEGCTPWDKGRPSPPLTAWAARANPEGRALVPGCGVGHDVAMLVELGLDALGVDLSPTAVRLAKERYPALESRFVLADLFALPPEWKGAFDWVMEHTCLCALTPDLRQNYARTMRSLLRPGGRLAGIWFIDPEMDPGETGPPFGISLSELDLLFPAEDWAIEEDAVPAEAYEGRLHRERLRVLRRRS